jgi:hypothetical protein
LSVVGVASGNLGKSRKLRHHPRPPIHYAGTLAQRQAQAKYGADGVERRQQIARALALRAGW